MKGVLQLKKQIPYYDIAPKGFQQMVAMEKYTSTTGIDPKLKELIKIRASQLNGCAYCLQMHTKDARKLGETNERIDCLATWKECTFYTDAEKAVLELTEHITLIASKRVPTRLYDQMRLYFSDEEYVAIVFIINHINNWNRLSISMGMVATDE